MMLSLAASLALLALAQEDTPPTVLPQPLPGVTIGLPDWKAQTPDRREPLRGQVKLPKAPNGPGQAGLTAFAELEVSVLIWPARGAAQRDPVRIQDIGVGHSGALEIPWTEAFSQIEVTVESDRLAGHVKLRQREHKELGDAPFEVPLHSGVPVVFQLVPPADSHFDPAALLGRSLSVRYFQHETVRPPALDQRMATVEEGLLVRVRAFDFGANEEPSVFRRTVLAFHLLPFAIDRHWRPGALPAEEIIEVPLVDTCTAVVRITDGSGKPVEHAKVRAAAAFERMARGRRPADGNLDGYEPGVVRVMGLADGDFELVVEAEGLRTSRSVHLARRGELPIEVQLEALPRLTVELTRPVSDRTLRLIPMDDPRGVPVPPLQADGLTLEFPFVEPGLHALAWGQDRTDARRHVVNFRAEGAVIVYAPEGGGKVTFDPDAEGSADVRILPNSRRGFSARSVELPRWEASAPAPPQALGEPGSIQFTPAIRDHAPTQFALAALTGAERNGAPRTLRMDGALDAQGRVRAGGVEAGRYLAHFSTRNGEASALVAFDGVRGRLIDLGLVEMAPLRKLAVHCADAPTEFSLEYGVGSPTEGALSFSMLAGALGRRAVSLPFNAEWLRAHWLHPETARLESETARLSTATPERGQAFDIVELSRSSDAPARTVTVVDGRGQPLALGTAEFRWTDGSRRSALLDRAGRAQIPGRTGVDGPAKLLVFSVAEPGALAPQDAGPIGSFTVPAAEGKALEVQVPAAEVHGRVAADLRSSSFDQKCVALLPWPVPPDVDLFNVPTGTLRRDGSFVVRHAPDGRHVVALLHARGSSSRSRVPGVPPRRRANRWILATSTPFVVKENAIVPNIWLHEGLGSKLPPELLSSR